MRTLFLALTLSLLGGDLLDAQEAVRWDYETTGAAVSAKGREVYFYAMRAWPFGKIPQHARLAALGTMEKMPHYGSSPMSLAESSWRQIGPFNVGGRIRSIALHPSDGQTLWIGAADGGVWKSTDRGRSWTPQMQDVNAIAMGAIAVDPTNPAILYAGTGELSSNVDAYTGAGIFKSTDGGDSWRAVGLTNVGAFSRIVVRPDNGSVIYAGATKNNDGFYRSDDGGVTWRRTFDDPVSDIDINPQNPDEVWIALMAGGIRYSGDGGLTFSNRSSGIGGSGITVNRMTVAVAPSNPSILYALAYEYVGSNTNINYSRIYRTTDGGVSWTRVFDNDGGDNFLGNPGSPSQGWYNNAIAVKPDDPDHVIAGGVRMVRSTNGGGTWNRIGSSVHPDHHDMIFDPTNPAVFYDAHDGGMSRSEDAGNSFETINEGLAVSQFYAMAIDQRQADVTYGGTQDNGTLTTNSNRYGDVFGGDGFHVEVDPEVETIIYIEREHGQMYRLEQGLGATPLFLTGDFPVADDLALWSAPLELDPNDPERLFSGRERLYVTFNPRDSRNGVQWFAASDRVPGLISAIGISPHDSKTIFIGSAQGVVRRTTDETESWVDLSFGRGLPNRAVTDFEFSRSDPETVYITYSGFYSDHVYRSTDLGESWTSISAGLPDIPVNALALHPEDENVIFAGTDLGTFVTLDGGQSWSVFNEGLPRVAVVDLEVHLETGTLRAATHGRSMFERGIGGEPIVQIPSITSPHGGEVWTGGTANVLAWGGFNDPAGVRVEFSLDDGRSWRELGASVGGATFRWNTVNTATIEARIRVSGMSDPTAVAVSNTFTIQPFSSGALLNTDSKPTVPYGIAYDGEYLWTTNFEGNTLLALDPETLDAVEEVRLGARAGDSLFTDITYYPPRQTFFLHRLNSTTNAGSGGELIEINRDGSVRGAWTSPAGYPIGLAWLGELNPDSEFPYLVSSDRDGQQRFYFYEPESLTPGSGGVPAFFLERDVKVESGPRGLTADIGGLWQVITDFTGGALQSADVMRFNVQTLQAQEPTCEVPLSSPQATTINARGVELDQRDKSLWITDFAGNIFKIASCTTPPGPSDSGYVSSVTIGDGTKGSGGIMLSSAEPNPFAGATSVTLTLASPQLVTLTLYDARGRRVETVREGMFEAGTHRIRIEPRGLPAGRYQLEARTATGTHTSLPLFYVR